MKGFFRFLKENYSNIYKVFLFIAAAFLLVLLFPKEGKFKYDFQKGKPWLHDDLIAPFDFAIEKSEEELENETQQIIASIVPNFNFLDDVTSQNRNDLLEQFEESWKAKYKNRRKYNGRKTYNRAKCMAVFDTLFNAGIIEMHAILESNADNITLNLIKDNVSQEVDLSEVYTLKQAQNFIRENIKKDEKLDADLLIPLLENNLARNLRYNAELTNKEKDKAISNISPSRGAIQTGQRIISKGELITPEKFQILTSLKLEYENKLGSNIRYDTMVFGQVILVGISVLVLVLFLISFKTEIFYSNKRLLLILIVVLMMVAITSYIIRNNVDFLYIVPICIVPVIMRAFFDSRLALFVHLVTIILIGFLVPNSFEFVFMQLIAGIIAILSILNLERRAQFFITSFYIFLVYTGIYSGLALLQEGDPGAIEPVHIALFAGSAILTLFSYPFIYVFEKIFGFVTDVSLLELSNTHSKLLRELAMMSPGTFQHSMQVANLAEEAIYDIGGNVLLTRAGAMYHDIGKMENPQFFVENQTGGVNPHNELNYDESAKIITSHVLKGVEIGRKYKLPDVIIDFIRTHHGTRRTEYFYARYLKDFPGDEDAAVFHYKGPVPYSKETAVVMMADTVEAASRSLKDPDANMISELVEKLIDRQMQLGQFDNAAITLKEINRVKKIFKKKLMNIYHVRIEYPD